MTVAIGYCTDYTDDMSGLVQILNKVAVVIVEFVYKMSVEYIRCELSKLIIKIRKEEMANENLSRYK